MEMHFSSDGSCELDVWPYLSSFSGDVISEAAFGSYFEEGERFNQLQKEQASFTRQILNSVYIPLWRFLPTKRNRRMKQIFNEMDTLLRGIINTREKAIQAGKAPEYDMLGILRKSNSNKIQEDGNDKKAGISMEEVMKECKLFYFVGKDNCKDLINWTIGLLAKHQDWQKRAREEVLQVFNNRPDNVGLNQLKIVTMILHEVLRLYSPGIQTFRQTNEETKVGDIYVPAGVFLVLPMIFVHHDKEIWGDDVHKFRPERFAGGVTKASKMNQIAAFFPFSTGPRTCIGQNFTMIEAKTIIAMILLQYSFEISPAYKHAPFNQLTLESQYGSHVIFHKI